MMCPLTHSGGFKMLDVNLAKKTNTLEYKPSPAKTVALLLLKACSRHMG